MSSLIQVIKVVEAAQDVKYRIPLELRGIVTFFSAKDQWMFHAVLDDVVCTACAEMSGHAFTGDYLRGLFPYLEIMDEDTIMVNIHPNCRCYLERGEEEL